MPHVFAYEDELTAELVNRYLNHSVQFEHRTGVAAAELVQPASTTEISAVSFTRQGRLVVMNFNWKFNDEVIIPTVGANGNVTNADIAQVGGLSVAHQGYWPKASAGGGSGGAGRLASYAIDTFGSVQLAAVAPGSAIVAGEMFSCAITYATVGDFDQNGDWT